MNNTTPTEDRLIDACESFGGKAEELVEIIRRFDAELDRKDNRIAELEEMLEEANER